MEHATGVQGRQRTGHLTDDVAGLLTAHRAIAQQCLQRIADGELADHERPRLLTSGLQSVQYPQEPRISDGSGLAGGIENPAHPLVIRGQQVHEHGARQHIVGRPPGHDAFVGGEQCLQAVTAGEHQPGGRGRSNNASGGIGSRRIGRIVRCHDASHGR
ncbi:hypothetical protein SDC9_144738 [bioreactor metagenome]|uniref:Uncharacterized protein n=1 Tax=bioreactor metagenome TaxID=1076179 RepID=A0A645E6V9_9ZZZZ